MKRFFAIVALTIFAPFFVATDASALFGLLDKKYSRRPYDKLIVNGEVRAVTNIIPLPEKSYLIEWKNEKGTTIYYWVEKRKDSGEVVWQASPMELSTYEYTYRPDGKAESVLLRVIWPELKSVARNPRLEPCTPKNTTDCYTFNEAAIEMLLTAERDENGVITGGTVKNTFFTKDGRTLNKEQKVRVTYPNQDTMRITFEGFGEPWAYVDAWQEYRIENGKLVWEICRNFGKDSCTSKDK
ncbi:hypothetical protein A2926_04380 [Candidatus Giovannonibacteria bacterium RIFCSPLOWO2_01_FULL_44_40]|uniref:DUF3108 domain-containing protein n=1 Tax=Candidatus Giovannonibacteria bacterium RIFCSPHIGHO2_01_FULL_45_23 TaxID=1798325 RepID=A0A1F5VFW8_9BACT|nr:MAG: hypothetical protein A2834_04625 [Candidatus Giovannonibacteria bacterium RIFCSPHIGHO2_01_FULL_45_23]OGF75210.1 MAG: hypothetical protein A3C77_02220 [Candidatus Giovannonibacteria bacterium RIFCSPHIGHO2_02_FULL_45_13]OGF79555.1 MAG: hypothetical protein A2926_04380 [Candidatus Giovannonibacteria bacterium RIFCSPLOWO2_01_FULL_44_40]